MSLSIHANAALGTAGQHAAPTNPDIFTLTQRFDAMLQGSTPAATPSAAAVGPVRATVEAVDASYRQLIAHAHAIADQAPSMSLQEIYAAQISISAEAATHSVQITTTMSAVQGSKNSLQTLMKNQ